ncbi:MAG: hypothetical protein A2821_00850 [Candidatus Magasanikbacteria bacterium RIFCSPHIGHO2_01_FULL_41_23]|uniref:Amine oxidase domain-containing protein n=1 Tax=Candidatus Magasanikbacteria bacterium RIFCSPLOWO2_01_FULL_40_15 TaxID=1798686 RepID=A0A1F6N0H4_9BACT|nr:MAG: hypothetical protein A2821_00850 [Candidatus Magasanikbacteria bacterium RIFCSPHIGHO2_01_FULL_41_23]OGH74723.1 MAG: hypothetical protein A3F22_02205 [Candidatus Magasanikbacteria bacterium RIFCSPHIGHO2_12_FULL_41_16]OGH77437.1 MAG: hypothetical protein A2983_01905 [Candidatus Magasanikbacteria bacterium RIFCSPLOWO2_01_FULL_40_15]
MRTKPKIAIIGAGLSGLATAYELTKDEKYAVTVFEAREEVGGRVKSILVNDHPVDVGGFIIYPWYDNYHRIMRELDLVKKLVCIKNVEIYYQLEPNGKFYSQKKIPVSMTAKVAFATRVVPGWLRNRPDFRTPDIQNFGSKTIAEFLPKKNGAMTNLAKFIDCVNQGYCYPALDQFQMSFYAPFIYQTLVHGDLRTGCYFGGNNQLFTNTVASAIKARGGKIHCNATVTAVHDKKITVQGKMQKFDAIVWANSVSALYKNCIEAPPFSYTHFYAAVVRVSDFPPINGKNNWTAIFTAPCYPEQNQITSLFRAENMASKLESEYLIINYKTVTDKSFSNSKLSLELNKNLKILFPQIEKIKLVAAIQWKQTMPIATTDFVAEARAKQGNDGHYFAGDYLGAPSMETALSSGVAVADLIMQDI